jgi:hypothetical protein
LTGNRCTGVDYTVADQQLSVEAAEVVMTAGAIGAAHLLLLSGIGPAQQLRDAGVDVVLDLPGVGTRFQHHPMSTLVYEAARPLAPVSVNPFAEAVGLLRSDPAEPAPNLHVYLIGLPLHAPAFAGPDVGYSLAFASPTRPSCRQSCPPTRTPRSTRSPNAPPTSWPMHSNAHSMFSLESALMTVRELPPARDRHAGPVPTRSTEAKPVRKSMSCQTDAADRCRWRSQRPTPTRVSLLLRSGRDLGRRFQVADGVRRLPAHPLPHGGEGHLDHLGGARRPLRKQSTDPGSCHFSIAVPRIVERVAGQQTIAPDDLHPCDPTIETV